tara:strand:+ start:29 stop:979 length:951 start_codon:yes stop_codon:yes gene_type:complete
METHLITGCAGFISKHLIQKLIKEKIKIIGIDNFLLGNKENIDFIKNLDKDFLFFEKDLSKKENTDEIITELKGIKIHKIWHLAANSDIRGLDKSHELDYNHTFLTTLNSLILADQLNIKNLIFSSSSAVFGEKDKKIKESTGPLLPISYYGAMKMASEGIISAAKSYHLDKYTIFRFPNVVGSDSTHGVIFDFINKLKADSKVLKVLGNGEQMKPYLHIDDLVDAMLYLEKQEDKNRIFNISPFDQGIKVKDIAEMCANKFGNNTEIIYEDNESGWIGDVPYYSYDTEKQEYFGFQPKYSSKEAVSKVLETYKLD